MKNAALLFCGTILSVALTGTVAAYESGDSFDRVHTEYVRTVVHPNGAAPLGFYPTQRYYTKNGVIAYGFVPVDRVHARKISPADPFLLNADLAPNPGTATRVIVGSHRLAFRETRSVTAPAPLPAVPPAGATAPAVAPPAPPPPTPIPAAEAPTGPTPTPAPAGEETK